MTAHGVVKKIASAELRTVQKAWDDRNNLKYNNIRLNNK